MNQPQFKDWIRAVYILARAGREKKTCPYCHEVAMSCEAASPEVKEAHRPRGFTTPKPEEPKPINWARRKKKAKKPKA